MSQFECIGLDIKGTRAFEDIIDLVFANGDLLLTPKGSYYTWSLGNEIDLWASSDSDDEINGPMPHVRNASRIFVSLTRRFPDKVLPLEGCFEAWPNPRIIMFSYPAQASGSYPLTFRCPGFRWYDHLHLPALAQVQLVGFPHYVEIDKKMEKEPMHIEGLRWDDEYIIPSGTFVISEDQSPAPIIDMGGVIIAQRMILNTLTSTFVYLATVRTYDMDLDVLLPLHMVEKAPKVGQIIRGQFLLSGTITGLTYPFGISYDDQRYVPFMDISITIHLSQPAEIAAKNMLFGDPVTLTLKPARADQTASIVIRTLRGQRLCNISMEQYPKLTAILQAGITPAARIINKHIRKQGDGSWMDLDICISLPPGTQSA